MKIADLKEAWMNECQIDFQNKTNLFEESARSPILHAKYANMLLDEQILLCKMKNELDVLEYQCQQFVRNPSTTHSLFGAPTKLRPQTNEEVKVAVAGNPYVAKKKAEYAVQMKKCEYIEQVLWEIGRRKDHIKNMISDRAHLAQ